MPSYVRILTLLATLAVSATVLAQARQAGYGIDQLDQKLALGVWLFSLPSLAYMRTQFDDKTVDMYGTASQLSTIEKWQEIPKK